MTPEQPEERSVTWHWEAVQVEEVCHFCSEAPEAPEVGAHWFNVESRCLFVWDGAEWEDVPPD